MLDGITETRISGAQACNTLVETWSDIVGLEQHVEFGLSIAQVSWDKNTAVSWRKVIVEEIQRQKEPALRVVSQATRVRE